MTEAKKISAPVISRILNNAGLKRALTGTNSWSRGFAVTDFGRYVKVAYTAVNTEQAVEILGEIAEIINNRADKKYFATLVRETYGFEVQVVAHDETDPEQNEARRAIELEKLAALHPAAPEIKDVRKALLGYGGSEFVPNQVSGFHIERKSDDTRLVRVTWRETSFTSYGKNNTPEEKESIIHDTLENFGHRLVKAGFDVQVDYDDDWCLIVGMPGEFTPVEEETPEEVREALLKLREAVEDDDSLYSTRRAGDYSVFVRRGIQRLEVFYGQGEYRSKGFLGRGETVRFTKLDAKLLNFIRDELIG
jgi:hypothetical protein